MATFTSPRTIETKPSQSASGLLRHALNTPLASVYLVLASAGLLIGLGVLMVASASSVLAEVTFGDPYYFVKRQVVFLVLGAGGAWVIAKLSPRTLRAFAWPMLIGSILMLCLTFTPLGVTLNGNRNWVQFGTPLLRFQPSELAKLAIVVWGADNLTRKDKLLGRWRELVPYAAMVGVIVLLVMLQHDLGTAIVIGSMLVLILFLAGIPLRMLGILLAAVSAAGLGLVVASPMRMARIFGFLNPGADTDGINQQPLRALYALASGGWWGQGLGASKQKWGMLAEAQTDYVFAVVGEELGLIGTASVILLFAVLVYSAFRIAHRSDSVFCRHLATGVGAWFFVQATLNMAVVLRLMPVTGVPLPFISYGGTSLLATLAAIGVLVACARHEPAARKVLAGRGRKTPKARVTTVVDGR